MGRTLECKHVGPLLDFTACLHTVFKKETPEPIVTSAGVRMSQFVALSPFLTIERLVPVISLVILASKFPVRISARALPIPTGVFHAPP